MCNDAIRIALEEKPKNRFRLIELAYPRLKEYGLHTHYILSACEVAFGVCREGERDDDSYPPSRWMEVDSSVINRRVNETLLKYRLSTKPAN